MSARVDRRGLAVILIGSVLAVLIMFAAGVALMSLGVWLIQREDFWPVVGGLLCAIYGYRLASAANGFTRSFIRGYRRSP